MDIEVAPTPELAPDTESVLRSYAVDGFADKASVERLLEHNPAEFCRASIGMLAEAESSAGFRYLVHLLIKHGLLMNVLGDAENCRLDEAIAVVKAVVQIGSSLEPQVERHLSALLQESPSPVVSARIFRFMQLLAEISKTCFLLFQSELISYPDPTVRASAVLLIGRAGKNADLMARMLLDPDPRVQANAVEALWIFKEDACKPMLFTAAKSKHHRVAGNAAVGLYRLSEIRSIAMLMEMTQHKEPLFRRAAIWAMGETGDARFGPALTDMVRGFVGDDRVAALQALTRIRGSNQARAAQPSIAIRIARSETGPANSRHLVLKLVSAGGTDLHTLKPTDFAIWEGGKLVCDYSVSIPNSSVLLLAGFAAPRILSEVDPYRIAIADGLRRCLALKRPEDVWRIDRYTVEGAAETLRIAHVPFYDDLVLGTHVKTQFGFLAGPDLLNKLLSSIGSRERTVADLLTAADKVNEALAKLSGKRHLFLFLHSASIEWPLSPARLQQFADVIRSERIVLHAFSLESSEQWNGLREVCLACNGGTFTVTPVEELPVALEEIYSELVGRFEIRYNVAQPSGEARLSISSDFGCGESAFSLASSALHVTERKE